MGLWYLGTGKKNSSIFGDLGLKLQIADDAGSVSEVAFEESVMTIGRAGTNSIQLDERNVSRSHARLVREGDDCFIEDAGSSFGLRVNGTRVASRSQIFPGDRIVIGDYTLRLAPNPDEVTAEIEVKAGGPNAIPSKASGHLVVLTGADEGAAYPLDQTPMTLGSAEHNPISIRGRGICEVHAEFTWTEEEGFSVEEMNGVVRIDGVEVESALLTGEERIELGGVAFALRLPMNVPLALVTTAPTPEVDPQESATIQGSAEELEARSPSRRNLWIVMGLAVAIGVVIAAWWAATAGGGEETPLTSRQADQNGLESAEEKAPVVLPKTKASLDILAGKKEEPATEAAENKEEVAEEEAKPSPAEQLASDAKTAMADRRWDEAITLYQKVLEGNPDDADAKIKLEQCEVEERRKNTLKKIVELKNLDRYVQAWEVIKADQNTFSNSVYHDSYMKHRTEVEEKAGAKVLQAAEMAFKRGDYKLAMTFSETALEISSGNKAARKIRRDAKARLKGKSGTSKNKKGTSKSKKKNAEKDSKAAAKALANQFYQEGRAAKRSGNNDLAIQKFKESLSHSKMAKANKQLGILYAVRGDSTKAVKYYKAYLKMNPKAKDRDVVRSAIEKLGGTL